MLVQFEKDTKLMTKKRIRQKGKQLTAAERAKIVQLHAEGMPNSHVAERIGCSANTVRNALAVETELAEICAQKKAERKQQLSEWMATNSDMIFGTMGVVLGELVKPEKLHTARPGELATVFGILYDKMRGVADVDVTVRGEDPFGQLSVEELKALAHAAGGDGNDTADSG